MTPIGDVEDNVRKYRETADRWSALVGTDPKRANRDFDRLRRLAKTLRTVQAGRDGLEGVASHGAPGAKLLAATQCLLWNPEYAVKVLEELEKGPSIHGLSARYTLRAYRAGTLDLQ